MTKHRFVRSKWKAFSLEDMETIRRWSKSYDMNSPEEFRLKNKINGIIQRKKRRIANGSKER